MNFYVRKLGHQECGYSKGKGAGQRGRYILISKKYMESFFPMFDPKSEERSVMVGVIDDKNRKVNYCQFNWHKGNKFGQSKHLGSDVRFYLNKQSFPSQDHFRPGDYAVFYKYDYTNKHEEYFYKILRFTKLQHEYDKLEELTKKDHLVRGDKVTYHGSFNHLNFLNISNIQIDKFDFDKKILNVYKNPDSTCSNKNEYKKLIRAAYNFKCAVSNESFIISRDNNKKDNSYMNLDAAHFWPDAWGGPLRPDNGMLLNKNLHWAFDLGLFTVSDDYKIIVHDSAKELKKFENKFINLPENDIFFPNKKYLKIHREYIYGTLKPIRSKMPEKLKENLKNF